MKGCGCDGKPRSPYTACGLSLINPQNLPRLALLACGVVYIARLVNGGFFYIDTSNLVNFGGCFVNGDLFSLCVNGLAVAVVSVMLATVFTLKDVIMCGVNNCSWMRWMQIVEGVTFVLLSVWWIVTAVILDAAWQNSIHMDTASRTNNSSITVADNILADTHENKLHTSLGYQLFGISIGCAVSNGIWLLHWFIRSQCRKTKVENHNQQLSEQPYLGMKDP